MDYDDYALPIVTTLPEELALVTGSAQSVATTVTPDATPIAATDAKPVSAPATPVIAPVATTTATTPSAATPSLAPAFDVLDDDYTLERNEGVQDLDYEDLLDGVETAQTISIPTAASEDIPPATTTTTSVTTASATSVNATIATVSAPPINSSAASVIGTPPVMSPPTSSLDYSGDDESEYYFLQAISEDELGSENILSNVSQSSPVPSPATSLSSSSPVTAILTSTIPSPTAAAPSPVPSPATALSPSPVPSPAMQVPSLSPTASGGTAARPAESSVPTANPEQSSAAAGVDSDDPLPGHGHAGGRERKRPRKRPGVGRIGDEGGRHHRGGEVSREFDSPHKVTHGSGSTAGDLTLSSKSAPDRGEQQSTIGTVPSLQPVPSTSKSTEVEAMDNPGSEYEASWGIKGVDVW